MCVCVCVCVCVHVCVCVSVCMHVCVYACVYGVCAVQEVISLKQHDSYCCVCLCTYVVRTYVCITHASFLTFPDCKWPRGDQWRP